MHAPVTNPMIKRTSSAIHGDFVLEQKDQQYYLFYCGGDIDSMSGVRIATSSDSLGRPGSWFKWWEGEWSFAAATWHLQCLLSTTLLHASQSHMFQVLPLTACNPGLDRRVIQSAGPGRARG